jgi:hypothetical protein
MKSWTRKRPYRRAGFASAATRYVWCKLDLAQLAHIRALLMARRARLHDEERRGTSLDRALDLSGAASAEQRGRRRPSRAPPTKSPPLSARCARHCAVRMSSHELAISRGVWRSAHAGRLHRHRLCVYAASRRVIEGSNPRDGLFSRPQRQLCKGCNAPCRMIHGRIKAPRLNGAP